MAGGIRIYGLNCCKEDALKDLSPGMSTHIVEHITSEFPSVKGIKNRSDNHLQEWHTDDPAWDLLVSADPFQSYFLFPDHLPRQIIPALHTGTSLVRVAFKIQPKQDSYL